MYLFYLNHVRKPVVGHLFSLYWHKGGKNASEQYFSFKELKCSVNLVHYEI